jgi:hypothetical protein
MENKQSLRNIHSKQTTTAVFLIIVLILRLNITDNYFTKTIFALIKVTYPDNENTIKKSV